MKPPALLLAAACAVTAFGIGMTAVGSQTIGVSTDEPGHVHRTNTYLKSGLYIRGFERDLTADNGVPVGAYVYGPITSLFQHDVQRALGTEPNWTVGSEPNQFAIRHAIIAITSIAGLLAAAVIAAVLLGSWRWGVVASGILAAVPLWTGQGMFNMKDVPVATGHTCLTLGLVLLAVSTPATRWPRLLASAAVFVFGVMLMVGTRPGTWPSLLASLLVFGVIIARSHAAQTHTHVARLGATVAAGLVVAFAGLATIYPRVFGDLPTALYVSATASANYAGLGDQPPAGRTYLLSHALTDLPLGLFTLMVAGSATALTAAAARRPPAVRLDAFVLPASQAFTLTVAAVALKSSFYDGLRQMLFVVPALAILATFGVAFWATKAQGRTSRWAVVIGAAGALALPITAQAFLFPYQYSYVNAAASTNRAGDDYFGTSFREYVHDGPQDVKITCPFLHFGGTVFRDDSDCRTKSGGTFSTYWRGRPTPDQPESGEFYTILRGDRPTPPNCTVYREVERRQNLDVAVMSRMFRCHRPTAGEIRKGDEIRNRFRVRVGLPADRPTG